MMFKPDIVSTPSVYRYHYKFDRSYEVRNWTKRVLVEVLNDTLMRRFIVNPFEGDLTIEQQLERAGYKRSGRLAGIGLPQ